MPLRKKSAGTPNAVEAAPDIYEPVFENDAVMVMMVTMSPGERVRNHQHSSYVIYVIEASRIKVNTGAEQDSILKPHAGEVMWIESGEHSSENIGETAFRALIVELK